MTSTREALQAILNYPEMRDFLGIVLYDRGIAALSAQQEGQASAQQVPMSQEISVDVSTGDADAGNRIFAMLTGEQSGNVWLAEETSRNFVGAQQATPEGWRLLKDSTIAERSFPEDAAHENGSYQNECFNCQRVFIGHKRRVSCRVCTAAPSAPLVQSQWQPLTKAGQVRVGDKLRFELCDEIKTHKVAQVLDAGTDREEIIYHKRNNWYVITSMAIAGKGSQKNVQFLASPTQPEEKPQAAAEINAMLDRLRSLRDASVWPLRTSYNNACDRLDVLVSKIYETAQPENAVLPATGREG